MSIPGEFAGEGGPKLGLPGEGHPTPVRLEEVIVEKKLTFEEASRCLNTLGKDETGSRYAYLMITACNRKLTEISVIVNFKHVLFLDLSGNYLDIDSLQVLCGLPFLVLLKVERNRIESASLNPMHYLQVLDMNQNQIKGTGSINQPLLECLEMNYNDIYVPQFESADLKNLKQLEMRSNLLFEISGIYPENLVKLYVAANKISMIVSNDFSKLKNLEVLHLRENHLVKLDGFTRDLASLKYLNLRNNKIKKLKELLKLQCLPKLETLIITGNPFAGTAPIQFPPEGDEEPGEGGRENLDPIRISVLVILPNLKRINKIPVSIDDKNQAEELHNTVYDSIINDDAESEENIPGGGSTTDLTTEYKTESGSDRFEDTTTADEERETDEENV